MDRDDDSGSAISIREMVRDHNKRLNELERVASELRGMITFARIVFGTSLVALILSVLTILALLAGHPVVNP